MPWTETRPMQRLDFIRACHAGTEPFSTLCRHFGISRKTGYKWLQRFNPDDPASLLTSPAPGSHMLNACRLRLFSSSLMCA
ncbi:helix-turn-helix domain-containing protein [Buttiauxella agrestis]